LALLAVAISGCAITRSQVKSLRDQDAPSIQFDTPISTTISALNAIPSHCGPAGNHRVRPEEFRVYEVVGRIARVKPQVDHDIHVELEDPTDPQARIVTESDDPDFRGNIKSPYRAKLGDARRMLEDLRRQSGGTDWKSLEGIMVRMTGVGFFDMYHLQLDRSRSCIELHPILTIERISDPK
jgi:hypothetical protein